MQLLCFTKNYIYICYYINMWCFPPYKLDHIYKIKLISVSIWMGEILLYRQKPAMKMRKMGITQTRKSSFHVLTATRCLERSQTWPLTWEVIQVNIFFFFFFKYTYTVKTDKNLCLVEAMLQKKIVI